MNKIVSVNDVVIVGSRRFCRFYAGNDIKRVLFKLVLLTAFILEVIHYFNKQRDHFVEEGLGDISELVMPATLGFLYPRLMPAILLYKRLSVLMLTSAAETLYWTKIGEGDDHAAFTNER